MINNIRILIATLPVSLIVLFFANQQSFAFSIAIPEPDVIVREVDTIAVGNLVQENDRFFFVASEVLKGDMKNGQRYSIKSTISEDVFPIRYYFKIMKGDRTIFLGQVQENTLIPIFASWSFWPQGIPSASGETTRLGTFALSMKFIAARIKAADQSEFSP